MPIELGVWRIDGKPAQVHHHGMDNEQRLEDVIERDIAVVAPHLMIIGRQVPTNFGKVVDLLAIDVVGNLAVLELKRDQTPRDVVAQALDYGSWVHHLDAESITQIWETYSAKFRPDEPEEALEAAFCSRFHVRSMPADLNSEHELIIVASSLDEGTERIVNYLAGYHEVHINVLFFRVFEDGDREYLTRVWLRDPTDAAGDANERAPASSWNGEYYVSFSGKWRVWEEARRYGFISAGGGAWYTDTLQVLSPGDRRWVNVPGTGYVGVGIVETARVPIDEFQATDAEGRLVPIATLPLKIARCTKLADDPEAVEYLVRVRWLETVPSDEAIRERGLFGNQNTVARPKSEKWHHTVRRLKQRFGIHE